MMSDYNYKNFFYLFVFVILLGSFFSPTTIYAGTLSCSVRTSACNADEVNIFKMQNTTNSHAGLPSATYNSLVCCGGITGIGNSCSGTFATAVKLSGATNAHVRVGTGVDYPSITNACISVPTGGSISVGYQATNCTGYDTTIGSMIGTTNSHVGDGSWVNGTTKICATASAPVVGLLATGTLISSVFDTTATSASIGYNSIMWKGTLGTGGTGKVRFQLAASNCANGSSNDGTCLPAGWSFLGGITCGALDYFDTSGPESPVELKGTSCSLAWNNKRYFKYKVQLCSGDCSTTNGVTSPVVDDIIVNWSP